MNTARVCLAWAILGGSLAGIGCTHKRNDSVALGDRIKLEALAPAAPGIVLADQTPSVTQIDRSSWERTEILVPVYGTAHRPTYVRVRSTVRETRRQQGEYPTDLSSLDLVEGTQPKQQVEGLTQPFRALGNAILIVPRMIFYRRPWSRKLESPREFYERGWAPTPPRVTGTAP